MADLIRYPVLFIPVSLLLSLIIKQSSLDILLSLIVKQSSLEGCDSGVGGATGNLRFI